MDGARDRRRVVNRREERRITCLMLEAVETQNAKYR